LLTTTYFGVVQNPAVDHIVVLLLLTQVVMEADLLILRAANPLKNQGVVLMYLSNISFKVLKKLSFSKLRES
jgi:hypothetical protein